MKHEQWAVAFLAAFLVTALVWPIVADLLGKLTDRTLVDTSYISATGDLSEYDEGSNNAASTDSPE